MKKILYVLMFVLFGFTVNAQTTNEDFVGFERGSVFTTGHFSYDDASENFNLGVAANVFFTSKLSLGVGFDREAGLTNVLMENYDSHNVSVNVRYYHTPEKRFSFFGELGSRFNLDDELSPTNGNVDISLNPGINYFISRKFSLESKLGLVNYELNNNNFSVGTNLTNIQLGLNYRF